MTTKLTEQSKTAKAKRENFWYSRENQKQLVYELASQIFVSAGRPPGRVATDQIIDTAQQFVDRFYTAKMDPETRR